MNYIGWDKQCTRGVGSKFHFSNWKNHGKVKTESWRLFSFYHLASSSTSEALSIYYLADQWSQSKLRVPLIYTITMICKIWVAKKNYFIFSVRFFFSVWMYYKGPSDEFFSWSKSVLFSNHFKIHSRTDTYMKR